MLYKEIESPCFIHVQNSLNYKIQIFIPLKMRLIKSFLTAFTIIILSVSCGPSRNLVYLSNIDEKAEYAQKITNAPEARIQPDDLLSIVVSSLNPEAIAVFNTGTSSTEMSVQGTAKTTEGHLVDKEGMIDYPVLGRVKLAGLTKTEAKVMLETQLRKYIKDPVVRLRFMNYKVTVVGEVNRPSTFVVPSEKINIIEALGMAGDMTVYGRRENVLVIREEEGVRSVVRLNLNDKEVLNSPYFYLQQNDMVYVEPVKAKAEMASMRRSNIALGMSITFGVTNLLLLLARFI